MAPAALQSSSLCCVFWWVEKRVLILAKLDKIQKKSLTNSLAVFGRSLWFRGGFWHVLLLPHSMPWKFLTLTAYVSKEIFTNISMTVQPHCQSMSRPRFILDKMSLHFNFNISKLPLWSVEKGGSFPLHRFWDRRDILKGISLLISGIILTAGLTDRVSLL